MTKTEPAGTEPATTEPTGTAAAAEPAKTEPAGTEAAAKPAATAPTTDIVPGPGGVMTDEVGVVTGDLTLRSELAGNEVTLRVQYKDADEWYTVTGGKATLSDPADVAAVHGVAVGLLHRPEG